MLKSLTQASFGLFALLCCSVFSGCGDNQPPAPGGSTVVPGPAPSQSSVGGSSNAISINNGVLKAAINLVDGVTVLEVADEEVLVYLDGNEVNSKGLMRWFKFAQEADAEVTPEGQMKLETIELTAGAGVSEDAVEACAAVIRELGLKVEIQEDDSAADIAAGE